METINIPKETIIELIRSKEAEFYDYRQYTNYRVRVTLSGIELEGDLLSISDEVLSDLLFERVFTNDYLTLIVK